MAQYTPTQYNNKVKAKKQILRLKKEKKWPFF
jgi:hypothetical protein